MTATWLVDPADPPERQNAKLRRIAEALMARVEAGSESTGAAYAQFQRAALLEEEVRSRTRELERAIDLLNTSNAMLSGAMREAEEARANLTSAIETVREGFALFDPDEVLVLCNSRFGMHMPDLHRHLAPGLRFADYVHLVSRSPHLSLPDGQTAAAWAGDRMTRHRDDHVMFNIRMSRDRWVQVSEHRTNDGGTVILQTDVTDIMRLERAARARIIDDQAELLRATLDHLDQGVCVFDGRARLAGWNRRLGELLLIPAGRLQQRLPAGRLFDWVGEGFTPTDGTARDEIRDWIARRGARGHLYFEAGRGERRISVFGSGMPGGGFVVSVTDVSADRAVVRAIRESNETLETRVAERTLELEAALAEAERANASKSRFVAAASHDLLQPLSAAKLYLASVTSETRDPRSREILDKTGRALASVETILDALLDISKLDAGRAEVHLGAVPIGVVLSQLAEEMAPLARQKGLALRVLPTRAVVASDQTYLRRILQNLIANAIRYTDRGRVLVGVRRCGDGVRVEVWDTGPGIPELRQQEIFREFHRLDAAASPHEGMGLGLAIVDRACALLGHRLVLRSEVGRGSGFLVELPRAATDDAKPAPRTGGADVAGSLGGRLALVVATDEVGHALATLLERYGMDTIQARTGAEGMALLAEVGLEPDVVLAEDDSARAVDGRATLAALRARYDPLPGCLVGGTTSQIDDGVPVIAKPVDPELIAAALSRVLTQQTNGGKT